MLLHIREARHIHDYTLWLRFNDGAQGEVDLRDELDGKVFEALKDPKQFARFHVDPDMQTIVWENGADMAPEFLYGKMKVLA